MHCHYVPSLRYLKYEVILQKEIFNETIQALVYIIGHRCLDYDVYIYITKNDSELHHIVQYICI